MFPAAPLALALVMAFATATDAPAADRIRLAVQRTGTLAWELDVIKTHGLDRKLDLAIEPIELASTEAGKVALKGGAADIMLSDWLWVARERSLGGDLVFYPSSSTLGAVMVAANSPIRELTDLKGKKLAVAGGPLDKSWLLLQALARRAEPRKSSPPPKPNGCDWRRASAPATTMRWRSIAAVTRKASCSGGLPRRKQTRVPST